MDYDDKTYYEPEEPVIQYDRETGEPYIINPAGDLIWVEVA